uniref:Uncharacterized protein n=1 Tax=Geospiza parvula TaxID=87175 RepID=A0A8U8AXN3_GEOPR
MACEFNLNFLKELEREAVLEVLYRDQMVRKTEEERIRKMKQQLQQLRWKGAKNARHEYQERSCARCQKSLGLLVNRGAVCNGCSHRVCSECRVCLNPCLWKCTICYAHGHQSEPLRELLVKKAKSLNTTAKEISTNGQSNKTSGSALSHLTLFCIKTNYR